MAEHPAEGAERLLVLGAGAGQLGLLESARARGLYVIAADRNPSAPGFRYADRRAIISVEDEPQLDRLATAERVGGVIAPGIDWPVAIAARISERLALPHPIDPATAVLATSKLRQRERFAAAGVPHPRHVGCTTAGEASAAAGRVRLSLRGQGARPAGPEGARARPGRDQDRRCVRARAPRSRGPGSRSSRSSFPVAR